MDMFSFLETILGNMALGIWQGKKKANPQQIIELKSVRVNLFNFTSFIRTLILGVDPTRESSLIQDTAIRNME